MKVKTLGTGAGLAVLLLVILLGSSLFVVSEAEQAVITQFGRPVRVIAGEASRLAGELQQKTLDQADAPPPTR